MHVSVVVSTYNRRDVVLRTARTLLQQDYPSSQYEIIVVVDGSADGTAEALRALSPRLCVLEQENRGPAAARNAGARAASGELLTFLDDDMTCEPELVREHVAAHFSLEHAEGEETAGPGAMAGAGAIAGLGAIYVAPGNPRNLAAEHFNRGL